MNSIAAHIPPPPDGRQQPRTHLFVSATLYADNGSTPVHIRNMSPSGALIEGAVLPDVGFRISLKRGLLQANGHIAWRTDRRAGVRLDAAVCVADWMSRNAGQERVDAVVNAIRSQSRVPEQLVAVESTIESELVQLQTELKQLESALVADVIVAATHPEIQTIDISLQRIDRLLLRVRAE